MMYAICVMFILWLICELIDTWQASKKTLHAQCYKKLYPNGYVDAAVGNARVDRAQPIHMAELMDVSDTHNQLPPGTYRTGLRWDDTIKDYRATAQLSTWVLGR